MKICIKKRSEKTQSRFKMFPLYDRMGSVLTVLHPRKYRISRVKLLHRQNEERQEIEENNRSLRMKGNEVDLKFVVIVEVVGLHGEKRVSPSF